MSFMVKNKHDPRWPLLYMGNKAIPDEGDPLYVLSTTTLTYHVDTDSTPAHPFRYSSMQMHMPLNFALVGAINGD